MTWLKCKHCLYNSCKKCDISANTINVDEEECRLSHVEKMEELCGEFEVQLTDMKYHYELLSNAFNEIENLLNMVHMMTAQLECLK